MSGSFKRAISEPRSRSTADVSSTPTTSDLEYSDRAAFLARAVRVSLPASSMIAESLGLALTRRASSNATPGLTGPLDVP